VVLAVVGGNIVINIVEGVVGVGVGGLGEIVLGICAKGWVELLGGLGDGGLLGVTPLVLPQSLEGRARIVVIIIIVVELVWIIGGRGDIAIAGLGQSRGGRGAVGRGIYGGGSCRGRSAVSWGRGRTICSAK
jgi:hypothetical protein